MLKFHNKIYTFFNPNTPWLCITAIEFLKRFIQKDMVGAEFGSGRSTYFNAVRCKHIISIEHDEAWYDIVKSKLNNQGINNIDYRFIPKQPDQESNELPEFYEQWGISYQDFAFRAEYQNYFDALKEFENESFDFLFVDGRARPECIFSAEKKLKKGGLLMLDNSERERYELVFQKLSHWQNYTCTSGLTDTTFWIKPD